MRRRAVILLALAALVGGGVGAAVGGLTGDVLAGLLGAGRVDGSGIDLLLVLGGLVIGGTVGAVVALVSARRILSGHREGAVGAPSG